MRRYIESARRRGVELRSAANNRIDGLKRMAIPNSTGNNGNPVANTKRQEGLGPVAIICNYSAVFNSPADSADCLSYACIYASILICVILREAATPHLRHCL